MWSADRTPRNLKCPNAVEALGMPEEARAPGGSQAPAGSRELQGQRQGPAITDEPT